MAGQRIAFDPNQYDQLLAQVQALVTDLRACLEPGADITLGPDLELQPEPQLWNVSADLVAAGRGFGQSLDAVGGCCSTSSNGCRTAWSAPRPSSRTRPTSPRSARRTG